MIPIPFLALTFAISLAGFAVIAKIPAARSPETPVGLPFWLAMVWGPSLAAIILSLRDGTLADLMGRAVDVASVPLVAWGLVLAPLALLLLLRPVAPGQAKYLGLGTAAAMIAFNLILGPLGEELGWRGYMQHRISDQFGWLAASVLIGVIWAVWHLPLWALDTPHAQISMLLFAGHVMCYSVIIGAAYAISGGSILPAILIHLTVNLASNCAIFAGFTDPNTWFRASLPPYAALAIVAALLVTAHAG